MPLTQSLEQLRANVRKFADVQGATALSRHPDADLNDYINRALGALHRRLTSAIPDQRILASTTITTSAGVSTYALPAGFDKLISLELTADGRRRWLTAYEMPERPALISPDQPSNGIPEVYRLRGGNIELLPTPRAAYALLLWYVPSAVQLSADVQTYDTISRLDDFIIYYAAKPIAVKDKNFDLLQVCDQQIAELEADIAATARDRDRNSPPRVIDVYQRDRWGRGGRWR